jgi:hypothetical protein
LFYISGQRQIHEIPVIPHVLLQQF